MSEPEPIDPNELPLAQLGAPGEAGETEQSDPSRPKHLRAIVVAAVLVVVVGMIVGIVAFNSAAPTLGRGAPTAKEAATRFVTAINAGDATAAAKIACDAFTDDARAAAASGRDNGISFVLREVRMDTKTEATARIAQRFTFPGGRRGIRSADVTVLRSGGRWLVCGQVS